jgi:hypothetical protein
MHMGRGTAGQVLAVAERPPQAPRCAGGLSGRPSCRIYPSRQIWVLELEPATGGWIEPPSWGDCNGSSKRGRLVFPTLATAIGYAERHGLDYRVVWPERQGAETARSRRAAGGSQIEAGPSGAQRTQWKHLPRLIQRGGNGG